MCGSGCWVDYRVEMRSGVKYQRGCFWLGMQRSVLHTYFGVGDSRDGEGGKCEIDNGVFPMKGASRGHDMTFNRV